MEKTFLVCTSHRGPSDLTLQSAEAAGVSLHVSKGVSDTALARNIAFDRALETETDEHDIVIFCDDDMGFTLDALQELASAAREHNKAVSALYVLGNGKAACHLVKPGDSWKTAIWWTGLGLIAVPLKLLRQLRDESEHVQVAEGLQTHAFTWSGVEKDRWMSEDYRFCSRLGGVLLAPVSASHSKTVPLSPDSASLEVVRLGGASKS